MEFENPCDSVQKANIKSAEALNSLGDLVVLDSSIASTARDFADAGDDL